MAQIGFECLPRRLSFKVFERSENGVGGWILTSLSSQPHFSQFLIISISNWVDSSPAAVLVQTWAWNGAMEEEGEGSGGWRWCTRRRRRCSTPATSEERRRGSRASCLRRREPRSAGAWGSPARRARTWPSSTSGQAENLHMINRDGHLQGRQQPAHKYPTAKT